MPFGGGWGRAPEKVNAVASVGRMKISFVWHILAIILVLGLCACQSSNRNLSSLMRDVDSYHKDLLFDRYEYAAKRIAPASRMKWLEAISQQDIHFSEIDVVSSDYCTPNNQDCVIVRAQVQWYSESSPSIQTSKTETTWEYNEETKQWLIVEQN